MKTYTPNPAGKKPPIFTDHRSAIEWATLIGAWPTYEEARQAYKRLYLAHNANTMQIWPRWLTVVVARLKKGQ